MAKYFRIAEIDAATFEHMTGYELDCLQVAMLADDGNVYVAVDEDGQDYIDIDLEMFDTDGGADHEADDATPLECQAKECKENEWDQRVAPTSWAHAEERFLRRIEDAPTVDAVPVVWCGSCKHIRPEVDAYTGETVGYWCYMMDFSGIDVDGFCSYGERKENNHEKD